ncbi:biopolymer transporter ExbD [bacterium]|nr:biopolymer transporter ExbD [bacterium]
MRFRRKSNVQAGIPSASMGDIAFLLIVFFMVTTTFSVDKSKVNLPESFEREATVPGAAIIVIKENGELLLSEGDKNPQPAGLNDVLVFALNLVAMQPQMQFTIKASRDSEYRYFDRVMEQLRDANAKNISLLSMQKVAGHSGRGAR